MNYVCAYEVVALFLIGLVTFFYHYKNWLPMYKNSFFSSVLHILLIVILFDVMNRMENLGIIELPDTFVAVLTLSSYIGVIISAVLFFQMELAKCRDKNFSGLPVNFANFEGSSVEELVTITVFSGSNGAKFL